MTSAANSTVNARADSAVIRTPSLALRHFCVSDARDILRLSREESLRTWIPDQVYRDEHDATEVLRYLIAQCAAAAPRSSPYVLAACLAASGELVGHVGFSPCGPDVEVGYAIAMAHQRRGLATECLHTAVPWALARFGLSSVIGVVAVDNVASCRALERAGFALERERSLHGRIRLVRQYRYGTSAA